MYGDKIMSDPVAHGKLIASYIKGQVMDQNAQRLVIDFEAVCGINDELQMVVQELRKKISDLEEQLEDAKHSKWERDEL